MINTNYKQLDSGILVPEDYKRYPTAFDFFSGAGGFSLGFIQGGFEVVGALDISPEAAHTYMANLGSHPIQIHFTSEKYKDILERYFEKYFKKIFKKGYSLRIDHLPIVDLKGEHIHIHNEISGSGWIKTEREYGKYYPPVKNFFFGDIKEVSGEWILERLGMKVGDLDAIIGGPPCQGFSKANNKRSPFDPRNSLVFEFARKVTEMKPRTFIMEEVPAFLDFVTPDGFPVIDALCLILEEGEFGTFEALRSSLLATSGVGLIKKGTGFRDKKRKQTETNKVVVVSKEEIKKTLRIGHLDKQFELFNIKKVVEK